MKRTETREQVFRLIYSSLIQKEMSEEQIEIFIEENNLRKEEEYVKGIFYGIQTNEEEIEKLIASNLKEKWSMERISKIDLAILKLAIFEMVYSGLPYKIAINEAVELAKKYCNEKAAPFINGVLSKIGQDMDEE